MPFLTYLVDRIRPTFARYNLQPPSSLYLDRDDVLLVSGFNAWPGQELFLAGRMLTLQGEIKPFAFRSPLDATRAGDTLRFVLGEGWLLGVSMGVVDNTAPPGSCYYTLLAGRGDVGTFFGSQRLLSFPAGGLGSPTWPPGVFVQPGEGPPWSRVVVGTNPAAGVDWSETVPTHARWRLVAFQARLITSAVAGNRVVEVIVDDGTDPAFTMVAPATQPASTTRDYTWSAAGYAQTVIGTRSLVGFPPDVVMLPGWRVRAQTTGLDAGDDWGFPRLFLEDWVT